MDSKMCLAIMPNSATPRATSTPVTRRPPGVEPRSATPADGVGPSVADALRRLRLQVQTALMTRTLGSHDPATTSLRHYFPNAAALFAQYLPRHGSTAALQRQFRSCGGRCQA